MKTARRMLLWVLIIYISLLGFLYIFQRKMVFLPSPDDPFIYMSEPFSSFSYQTSDGLKLRGMWHAPKENMPTIVYFHGNAGNLEDRLFKAELFIARGYGIALVGYHGYDGNPGVPSETNLYADARAAIKAIHDQKIEDKDIILYGESLGTGVATQMASEYPNVKALILEAPYTSLTDIASQRFWYFPVKWLMRDRFESSKKIGILKVPILVIHGTGDLVVPYRFGKKLFDLVTTEKKSLVSVDGAGHSNLYEFGAEEAVHDFIQTL